MMLTVRTRIHLATEPVNLQCSIDGLCARVRGALSADPLSGHLFVFYNRRKNALKCLYWDTGGFCVLYKRLSRGQLCIPPLTPGAAVVLSSTQLAALLEGVDVSAARVLPRWNPDESRLQTVPQPDKQPL
jgi:transposase